jgi:hypothetical protein
VRTKTNESQVGIKKNLLLSCRYVVPQSLDANHTSLAILSSFNRLFDEGRVGSCSLKGEG